MADDSRLWLSQWAFASPGATIKQAGRDIIEFHLPEREGAGLVSVVPPWARLPEHLRGRDTVSADLLALLDDPPGKMVVLHGAGGYGKSVLALWLARQAATQQVPVWWVAAGDGQPLADEFREVALQSQADPIAVELAWSGRGSAPELLWRTLNTREGRWVSFECDPVPDVALLVPFQPGGPEQGGAQQQRQLPAAESAAAVADEIQDGATIRAVQVVRELHAVLAAERRGLSHVDAHLAI